MQCFIYKSCKKDQLYLYVAKKDDFSCVPEALLTTMGTPVYAMTLVLTPERKLAREESRVVMRNLREKGYFVQLPPVTVPAPLPTV